MYEYTEGLDKVVLLVFHRIVSCNRENKELTMFYKIDEAITSKYILDVPRLLELCEIYGQQNGAIVRYIVISYAKTRTDFYSHLTTEIFPVLFKKMEETLRQVKNQTDREEFGINFSYKRVVG